MCQNWPLFSIPRRGNSETMGAEPKKLGFEQKKNWAKKPKTRQKPSRKNPDDSVWTHFQHFQHFPNKNLPKFSEILKKLVMCIKKNPKQGNRRPPATGFTLWWRYRSGASSLWS